MLIIDGNKLHPSDVLAGGGHEADVNTNVFMNANARGEKGEGGEGREGEGGKTAAYDESGRSAKTELGTEKEK